mgnify:CR=1 FL=1
MQRLADRYGLAVLLTNQIMDDINHDTGAVEMVGGWQNGGWGGGWVKPEQPQQQGGGEREAMEEVSCRHDDASHGEQRCYAMGHVPWHRHRGVPWDPCAAHLP